jgi:hypothetical protein
MVSGIDSPVDCAKFANAIKVANLAFVGRYYRSKASKWPPLTRSEAQSLSKAGLQIVALWEGASTTAGYFTYARGVSGGATAYVEAMGAGQPAATPIYFAVDYDATAADISGPVNDYFAGIAAGYRTASHGVPAYAVGVYGSGASCAWLLTHGRAARSWLAVSSGWSGSKTFKNWDIKQGKPLSSLKFDNDSDEAKPTFGGFQVS